MMMRSNELKDLRKTYPVGSMIKCILMRDDLHPVPYGTIGTVKCIDDAGQIHMNWENGSTLALVPQIDEFIKIKGEKNDKQNNFSRNSEW